MSTKNKQPSMTAQQRLERLEGEYDEVAERLSRLEKAIIHKSEKELRAFIKKVGESQFNLLNEQLSYMQGYRDTLAKRIQLFRFENKEEL